MRPEDLLELLRIRPFQPFRLFATDGRTYDVRHPDQALVLRSRVILPLPSGNAVPEGSEHLALLHIVRAEVLAQSPDRMRANDTELKARPANDETRPRSLRE